MGTDGGSDGGSGAVWRAGDGGAWRLVTPHGTVDAAITGAVPVGIPRGATIDFSAPPLRRAATVAGRRPDLTGRVTALRGPAPVAVPCDPIRFECEIPEVPRPAGGFPFALVVTAALTAAVASLLFSPVFAVLAGISALAMVGRWGGAVVSGRRADRRRAAAVAAGREKWDSAVTQWAEAHAESLRDVGVDPAGLLASAAADESPWRDRVEVDLATSVVVGRASRIVAVPLEDPSSIEELGVDSTSSLVDVPLEVDLDPGLALCGDRAETSAAARWIVATITSRFGPADLGVVVVTTADRVADWADLEWVPSFEGVEVAVPGAPCGVADLLDRAARPVSDGGQPRRILVVVDGAEPDVPGVLAQVLSGRVPGVELLWVGRAEDVPAGCRRRVDVRADGTASVVSLDVAAAPVEGLRWFGLDTVRWSEVTRWLGRFADPEAVDDAAGLPTSVALSELIEPPRRAWAEASLRSLRAPLGRDHLGAVEIDLVVDGPHVLAAGTTGSGKSELLRTLVAGLAARQPPDLVSFVLIDFKGGGAFDAVASLPHVSAVVTDLEPADAERALRGLRAEVLDREHRLRDMEVSDVADIDPAHPRAFGRLVVVVDEFAALADELPDFLDGLVDIARRGRSLGVHLVLATQRPSGVVTGQIRANTNLRICLRVQDRSDARDVVDHAAAGDLPNLPGRAVMRRGGAAIETIQVAQVSGVGGGVEVAAFGSAAGESLLDPDDVGRALSWAQQHLRSLLTADQPPSSSSELRLVEQLALAGADVARPSAPWLPTPEAPAFPVRATTGAVGLGVLDDPDRRRQPVLEWQLDEDGLLVVGSDERRIAATAAVAVAAAIDAEPTVPVFLIDGQRHASESLAALRELAPVVDMVSGAEPERVLRTIDRLDRLGERFLLVVHDWASVVEPLAEVGGPLAGDRLTRLVRRGGSADMTVIVTARSDRDVPHRAAAALGRRLIHRLADPAGLLTFGLRAADAIGVTGPRLIEADSGLVGICAELDAAAISAVGDRVDGARRSPWPEPVRLLGPAVDRAVLPPAVAFRDGWRVPIGLDDELDTHWIDVAPRPPVVVVAQPGGGRSTALSTLGRSLGDQVCLIDDAERWSDDELRTQLAAAASADQAVLVASTPLAAKRFGSPVSDLLPAATIVLVNPTRQEGELLRVAVPDLSDQPIGRAVTVDRGRTTIVQIAA